MNYVDSVKSGFQKYATFSGRAARSEYWNWVLFCFIFSIVTMFLDSWIFNISIDAQNVFRPIYTVFSLIVFVPSLAVAVRRLHDTDYSGWWLLIILTGIGAFVLLYWYCCKGTEGGNRFGPDPLT